MARLAEAELAEVQAERPLVLLCRSSRAGVRVDPESCDGLCKHGARRERCRCRAFEAEAPPALARWPPAESTELQDSPVQHGGMAQVVHTWVQMFANFEVEVLKKRYANYIAKYQSKQGSQNIKIP